MANDVVLWTGAGQIGMVDEIGALAEFFAAYNASSFARSRRSFRRSCTASRSL